MSNPQRSWNDGDIEVVGSRLWAGGVATAVVAAGIGIVGVIIIGNILGVGIQTAGKSGALVDNAIVIIPVAAAIAALAATALLHLLLLTTPRPATFFSAIVLIILAVMVLQAFVAEGSIAAHIATAILYAAIGVAIISMLSGVSYTAVRPASSGGWDGREGGRQYGGRYDQNYGTYGQQQPHRPGQGYDAGPTQRYDPRGGSRDRWS